MFSPDGLPELTRYCEDADIIGVDSEFISFPNYRNQLQLLQIR